MKNESSQEITSDENPRVAVIISTYNGEQYIAEQIESILKQSFASVDIFIRDDGSKDGTKEILESYSGNNRVTCWFAENVGVTQSFFEALERVGGAYDYYAFCDQDDWWHPDKLSRAIYALEEGLICPKLFFSELMICDKNLNSIEKSQFKKRDIQYTLFYFDNMCSGNTMVFNSLLREIVLEHDYSRAYYHDWWLALVAAHLGKLYYCSDSLLDYRRTEESVSLNGRKRASLIIGRAKEFLFSEKLKLITGQINSFSHEYRALLSAEQRKRAELISSQSRLRKALAPFRLRQTLFDEFSVRLLCLFNLL